jgi:hypothetical protein
MTLSSLVCPPYWTSGWYFINLDDDRHGYRARLRLWTTATTGHPPPPVIYKHWEPWWNDVDRRRLLTPPSELSDSHLVTSKRNGRKEWEFGLAKYFYSYLWLFACHKILPHGASWFTSPQKESVLRIFIALKNSSPRPGLNPRAFGPMVSTLTITPPRWLHEPCCEHHVTNPLKPKFV